MTGKIKRTRWSSLPSALSNAGVKAFPICKSPRSVPDDKWEKLVVAYETWYQVLCAGSPETPMSEKIAFSLDHKRFPVEKRDQYLCDIALRISSGDL